jgi:transcriptional regulator with XRE-family HTH domain
LYQKDVATRLGVTTSTVWDWENTRSVDLRFIPRVIKFLGYNPISQPEDLMGKLAWYKLVNGLSLERLGFEMGRDPEQLADWLSGRHKPCRRNRESITLLLTDRIRVSRASGISCYADYSLQIREKTLFDRQHYISARHETVLGFVHNYCDLMVIKCLKDI